MTPELKAKIKASVEGLHGWCSVEKATTLANLILAFKPLKVVELGVFGGKSLIPMALALQENREGMIYGIDPWKKEPCLEGKNDPKNDEWWSGVDYAGIEQSCRDAVWGFGVTSQVKLLKGRGEDFAKDFAPGEVNLFHLDGNHSEETSVRDVNLWLPKIPAGGLVVADDVNWSTMAHAFALLEEKCHLLFLNQNVGTHWAVFRKR